MLERGRARYREERERARKRGETQERDSGREKETVRRMSG